MDFACERKSLIDSFELKILFCCDSIKLFFVFALLVLNFNSCSSSL